jgi:hypothetical protein
MPRSVQRRWNEFYESNDQPEGERRRQFDHASVTCGNGGQTDGGTKGARKRFHSDSTRGDPSEADMLLMCLPFVIYSASMQMFLDSLSSPAVLRERDVPADDDR